MREAGTGGDDASAAPTSSSWPASRADEIERARAFLTAQAELRSARRSGGEGRGMRLPGIEPAEAAAWVDFALALLNRNEFVYVP